MMLLKDINALLEYALNFQGGFRLPKNLKIAFLREKEGILLSLFYQNGYFKQKNQLIFSKKGVISSFVVGYSAFLHLFSF